MEFKWKPKSPRRDLEDYGGDKYYCSSFPEDILFEDILPRLPVESLVRFKCVSNKWLHYISYNPRFIHNHLQRQLHATKLSLVRSQSGRDRMLLWDYNSNKSRVIDLTLHMEQFSGDFRRYMVVGSCNGLVCLSLRHGLLDAVPRPFVVHQSIREAIVLWNPETGEGRDSLVPPLPPSFYRALDPQLLTRSIWDYHVFGFGFDEYHDDYKVVRVVPTQPTMLDFDVYSRNSGYWRRLDKSLSGYTLFYRSFGSVLLNGCLYWLVMAVESKSRCILSFDLRYEEFQIIDVLNPHHIYETGSPFPHQLVKWKENSLAYLSFPEDQDGLKKDLRVQLVLNRNGNVVVDHGQIVLSAGRGFSWTGDCSTTFKREPFYLVGFDLVRNTRISKLVLNDLFSDDCESVDLEEVMSDWCCCSVCQTHDYVPSLVSVYPNRKTMIEGKKRMEIRYWVDMYWKRLGLNKQQFGIVVKGRYEDI